MSIRLRLTLLYSVILALTLVIFSLVLYFSQSVATYNSYRQRLAEQGQNIGLSLPLSEGIESSLPPPAPLPNPDPQRPQPRRAYYLQVLDLNGDIIVYDPNVDDAGVLPLSPDGLQAVRRGQPWDETARIKGERFLVYTQPVTGPDGVTRIVQVAGSLEPRERDLATLRNILAVGSVATVMAAFGMGWILAGLALRPIHRITQTAQTIGTERDFSRRISHSGPHDEIGQLATTFNDMLTELQAAYLQVEQSLQAQQRFVADASHELRTPLTTLRGNIDLLRREPPIDTEDRADVLTDMVAETERLMRLVNDLLALARLDSKRPLRNEPVAIKPLLEEVGHQLKYLDPNRTIVYRIESEAALMGDRDALKQVLLILGDNALKHTLPEATITITTTDADKHLAISVSDNGSGIGPSLLPHIFDRFHRGNAAQSGSGAGLGLAIAKELTEAQNGTLTVESQLGQGTVFTLTFPKIIA